MIRTSLQYLARDKLYKSEKPYRAEFDIEETGNVKSTNHIFATNPVVIHAIQPSDNFELEQNGFCVLDEKITLDVHAALITPDSIESAYLQELEVILSRRFPEYKRLEPIEFVASSMAFAFDMHDLQERCCRSENATSDSHQP